jgi:cell shape-determining protein MreC
MSTGIWIAIGSFAFTIVLAFGTAFGRRTLSKLFKGETISAITQTSADAIATVESAYNVLRSEHERLTTEYAATIAACRDENQKLRERVAVLEAKVTTMADADELAKIVEHNHKKYSQQSLL